MGVKKKDITISKKKSGSKSPDGPVKISEVEIAEDELKNSRALLKIALDSSFGYIQVFEAVRDKRGKIIDFIWVLNNRRLVEKQGDRVGKSLLKLNPGIIASGIFDHFVQVTETGESKTSEFYYEYEGFQDWFHQTVVKFNDGFILTGEIITERKKAEQELKRLNDQLLEKTKAVEAIDRKLQHKVLEYTIELKENKELLQSIAEAIPDMISVQGYPSRKIIYHNREQYKASGLNVDELAKKTIQERHKLVHPEDLDGLQKYSDRFATLSNGDIATVEYRVINKLNEWIWLRTRGKVFERDEEGNVISIVNIIQNITEEKKVEEEIAKHHDILKQAEDLAKAGSWEYNTKTKEFLWSDGMYGLFNMNKGELVTPAIYLDHAIERDQSLADKIVTAIERSFQSFEETLYVNINGDVKAIRIKATSLKNNKGEIEKMLGVNMDITASLESAQKIMDLNESLLAMNKELHSLNSELRNFNSITANSYGETLRHVYINLETIVTNDARNLSDSGRANLRRAQSAIQKMKLLTNDINNYLELYDAGINKELISPKINLQNVLNEMKGKIEEANATIEISELPALSADPVLFSKLMTNLIDNSIKFKKPDENPVVRIGHTKVAGLNNAFVALTGRPHTIITIADNGIGFETTNRIFELFTQLEDKVKQKGSGMGLSICKKIMEMHGGYIIAEAEPGKGASFHCCFPE